ncbi:hypothetical protein LINPERPRIM_LOCUS29861 [Linum perenne]
MHAFVLRLILLSLYWVST